MSLNEDRLVEIVEFVRSNQEMMDVNLAEQIKKRYVVMPRNEMKSVIIRLSDGQNIAGYTLANGSSGCTIQVGTKVWFYPWNAILSMEYTGVKIV